MAGRLRIPRSRGAFSGLLLVLLGAWGGFAPFVSPYFGYAYTPDRPWVFTSGRFWLEILPAVATVVGGLIVLFSANRVTAVMGAWLAALGGAWFVVGGPVSTLWTTAGSNAAGTPVGGATARVLTEIAFFTGLGTLIVFLAALALGRFAVVGVKETQLAEPVATTPRSETVTPPKETTEPTESTPGDRKVAGTSTEKAATS